MLNKNQRRFRKEMKEAVSEQGDQEAIYSYVKDSDVQGYYSSGEKQKEGVFIKIFRVIAYIILSAISIFGLIGITTDQDVFALALALFLFSFASFILGLIHPSFVFIGRKQSRGKVAMIYGIALGICVVIGSLSAPSVEGEMGQRKWAPQPRERFVIQENREQFIASTEHVDYSVLARNPDQYKGTRVSYMGKVVQTVESRQHVVLRLNVTEGEFGLWTDTIYVNYHRTEGEDRILEDDIITLWGTVLGLKEYESVFGLPVVVPEIDARYIDITIPR